MEEAINSGYLIGARLGTPSADRLETNAIGLGTTVLVNKRYRSLIVGEKIVRYT